MGGRAISKTEGDDVEMKVVYEHGTKLVRILCTRCGQLVDWDRGSLILMRNGSRRLCCARCFGGGEQAPLEEFDRALALLDATEADAEPKEARKERDMEMKVINEHGTKLVRIPCAKCGQPIDWDRVSLRWTRNGSRQFCCVSCFGPLAPVEEFDRALKLLDEAERIGEFMAPLGDPDRAESTPLRGWSFRARLEDIDIARVCREAEEAGLECIEVGCPRSPDIGMRVLITRRLFEELVEYPHTKDITYGNATRRLDRQHPWGWHDNYIHDDLPVSGWVILLEHNEPVTAKRAAELLHAMRTLRDERLRCVVRAVG
jgi:hypothetical protein